MTTVLMATGKGINDLGDPDLWNQNPDTKHGILSLTNMPVFIGIWVPIICTRENMKIVEDALTNLAHQMGLEK